VANEWQPGPIKAEVSVLGIAADSFDCELDFLHQWAEQNNTVELLTGFTHPRPQNRVLDFALQIRLHSAFFQGLNHNPPSIFRDRKQGGMRWAFRAIWRPAPFALLGVAMAYLLPLDSRKMELPATSKGRPHVNEGMKLRKSSCQSISWGDNITSGSVLDLSHLALSH